MSRDSIEAMVRFLSIDPATTEYRSRFTYREAELHEIADSLSIYLERYTGNTADQVPFTVTQGREGGDTTYTAENIACRLDGSGEVSGVFMVGAHYDAIGFRTQGWLDNWQTWPAPGADDNATGVAAVLEIARVLDPGVLPFDIMFVLFSGEELGLLGSEDFAERFDGLYGDEIIGVINLDMIGYLVDGTEKGDLVTNYSSGWLADLIMEARETVDPGLPIMLVKPGGGNSDHRSFWDRGIPAVMFSEPFRDGLHVIYPYYHTVNDTPDRIDYGQAARITGLAAGFLAGLEESAAEVALLQSDLLFVRHGNPTGLREFEVGDSLYLDIRMRNLGGSNPIPGGELELTVTIENAHGTQTLRYYDMDPPNALRSVDVTIPILLDDSYAGQNNVTATVDVTGIDDLPGNNTAAGEFSVGGGATAVIGHHFQPNPVTDSFLSASFCIHLANEVNVSIEFFNLEGDRIDSAKIGNAWGVPLHTGLNCIPCGDIFKKTGELVSGVYIYRIRAFEAGGGAKVFTGQFAVQN